jgi:hypothetical protein
MLNFMMSVALISPKTLKIRVSDPGKTLFNCSQQSTGDKGDRIQSNRWLPNYERLDPLHYKVENALLKLIECSQGLGLPYTLIADASIRLPPA